MPGKKFKLENYVSHTKNDIYTIFNLPEEWIAVVFAKVSRSPASFREHILQFLEDIEKAKKKVAAFHEKWVLEYGHASIAEHAILHCGLEHISRHLSEILELKAKRAAFTEYSQRYQKPQRGAYYLPPELHSEPALKQAYTSFQEELYTLYEKAESALFDFHFEKESSQDEKSRAACQKKAGEDARYILSRACWTNLAMTINGRDVEMLISYLLSLPQEKEAQERGKELKHEALQALPTLVKYASEKPSLKALSKWQKGNMEDNQEQAGQLPSSRVSILKALPEEEALALVLAAFFYNQSLSSWQELEKRMQLLSLQEKRKTFLHIISLLDSRDPLPESFQLLSYTLELLVSEACWHQLLRHRPPVWLPKQPSLEYGFVVPPAAREAGIEKLFLQAHRKAQALSRLFEKKGFHHLIPYLVLNGHVRLVSGTLTLAELAYLLHLRTSSSAQWEIRETCKEILDKLQLIHPCIAEGLSCYLQDRG